ncbi:MAG: hypothetical protein K2Q12_11105, partial [Rickettsiales bacterium]|nr:hypothetical protein [Rickettsiales bacterium]
MVRASSVFQSFNGGELSPLLAGRTDLEKYYSGCEVLENMLPLPHGPAMRRRGTRYLKPIKDETKKGWLVPFIASVDASFMLEFGEGYIRFFTQDGQAVMNGANPYEITTSFVEADLPSLQCAQAVDIMYITCGRIRPQKLSRLAGGVWTIESMENQHGPLREENIGATTLRASATVGTVTINASAALFLPEHVGSVWGLSEAFGVSRYPVWKNGHGVSVGSPVHYEGRVYIAQNAGTCSTTPPVHESGIVSDGAINFLYANSGTGFFEITGYTSATQVTAVVQAGIELPQSTVTGNFFFAASPNWQEAAWSAVRGWPSAVTFHEQRLFFGGTAAQKQTVWGSRSNEQYEDFESGDAADAALTFTLASNTNDAIEWLFSGTTLSAGTKGGVFFIRGGASDDPLAPDNVRARKNITFRASSIQPIQAGSFLLYVNRSRKKLYASNYSFEQDSFIAEDVTVLSEHITASKITGLTYQQDPFNLCWATRTDGMAAVLMIEQNQKVSGWHRFVTDGAIEALAVLPGDDDDDVWMIVRRQAGGQTRRYIERLEPDNGQVFYVDSGVTYSGAATAEITGLGHLESKTVAILADGAIQQKRPVNGGKITLDRPASLVQVGLPYKHKIKTLVKQMPKQISKQKFNNQT